LAGLLAELTRPQYAPELGSILCLCCAVSGDPRPEKADLSTTYATEVKAWTIEKRWVIVLAMADSSGDS
jgi:hypothetical protein